MFFWSFPQVASQVWGYTAVYISVTCHRLGRSPLPELRADGVVQVGRVFFELWRRAASEQQKGEMLRSPPTGSNRKPGFFLRKHQKIELPSWKYLEILCWSWGLLSMILEFFGSGAMFKAIFKMKSTCPPVNSGCSSTFLSWSTGVFPVFKTRGYRCFHFIAVDLLVQFVQWLKRAAPHVSSTSWVSSGSLTWLWTIAHFIDDIYSS